MKRWFIIAILVGVMLVAFTSLVSAQEDSQLSVNSTGVNQSQYIIGRLGVGDSRFLINLWSNLPGAPTDFTITQTGPTSINITWTMGVGANTTLIRVGTDNYPENVTDGYLVYSGSGTYVEVDGLNLDSQTYYYRAWSYNDYGYSVDYAQDYIGGQMALLGIFAAMGIALLFGFFHWRSGFFGYGAAGAFALTAFQAFTMSGSTNPASITDTYMAMFWLCIVFVVACALLPTIMREKPSKEDLYVDEIDEVTGEPKPKEEDTTQMRKRGRRLISDFSRGGQL